MSIEWKNLPPSTLAIMKDLGNFGPTVNVKAREVKGYMHHDDGDDMRTYFCSAELRQIAMACNEVAAWLDARADEEQA